ncbi:cytochrome P450 [Artemisia annua]|uniref:Cytochrome P450 n=1 Tax=Artemisia annua TaxID=35608 RepID=A0A2U1NT95_ARTAN|nr:cytochrome P450 [Artemisia annua]
MRVKVDDILDYGPTPFKIFNSWFLLEGFEDTVKDAWDVTDQTNEINAFVKFKNKLKIVKVRLKEWHHQWRTQQKGVKKELLSKLDIDRQIEEDDAQKLKKNWEVEGDENSKFFHRLVKQQRRQNTLMGIMVEGNWINEPTEESFPRLFDLEARKDCYIVDQFINGVWSWEWNRLMREGSRTSHHMYELLKMLPTRSQVAAKGINIPSVLCPSCMSAIEDVQHVIFKCDVAVEVWKKVATWLDLHIPAIDDISMMI